MCARSDTRVPLSSRFMCASVRRSRFSRVITGTSPQSASTARASGWSPGVRTGPSKSGIFGALFSRFQISPGSEGTFGLRSSSHLHRNYDNEAPGMTIHWRHRRTANTLAAFSERRSGSSEPGRAHQLTRPDVSSNGICQRTSVHTNWQVGFPMEPRPSSKQK